MIKIVWAVVAAVSIALIGWRFEPVFDLGYFLPRAATTKQQVLLDRLGKGPGSQLVFVVLHLEKNADAGLTSDAVATRLRQSGLFARVINGSVGMSPAAIPKPVFRLRYLLSDVPHTAEQLRPAFAERYADLAFIAEPELAELISRDPTLASVQVLESLQPVSGGKLHWLAEDGSRAVLIAETRAAAFDMAGQQAALNQVRMLAEPGILAAEAFGVGVYGVDLQDTIRREATLRSVLATAAVLLLLLVAYRRPMVVVCGFMPLALGALAGLAAISALFGAVHGITLAFGFTLLGVAIDYPLHYLSHNRRAGSEVDTIWSTMRIGMIGTLLAFLAIASGGSAGLAQMGLFSAVGLLVAFFATRTLLPALSPTQRPAPDTTAAEVPTTELRFGMWLAVLALSVLALQFFTPPRWTNDLSVVTPVPLDRLMQDQQLRSDFGAPDINTVVAVRAPDRQSVLRATEGVVRILEAQRTAERISGYQSASSLLPSTALQTRRRELAGTALGNADAIRDAAVAAGFRRDSFEPFFADLVSVAELPAVSAADYESSGLENLLSNSLYQGDGDWVSVVSLFGISEPAALQQALDQSELPAVLVNLKDESENLMAEYRNRVLIMLFIAALLIVGYLWFALHSVTQLLWVIGTLVAAQAATLLASSLLLGTLSIFNLIAAVLVAGLGMDYALFFARQESSRDGLIDTAHAVTICAASTCAAFTILAFSSIPVLQSMGATVASGVAASYLLARLGRAVS